jgi:protocatechuate 3,4-dioxygenase beta subunit
MSGKRHGFVTFPGDDRRASELTGAEQGMDKKKIGRREAIGAMGAATAAFAFGCGGDSPTSPSTSSTTLPATTGGTNSACVVTPDETAGPYPSVVDLFRSDIREDRQGTLLRLTIAVVNVTNACSAVPGANVEIWHCDVSGNYSEYGTQTTRNYLRGIQTTDANGIVTFTTIYPGWYQGRATHIHTEVTIAGRSVKVTQIAFPESINNVVHQAGVYASRGTNPTSNLSDGIFADSLSAELVTPTGDPGTGYSATFQIAIAA